MDHCIIQHIIFSYLWGDNRQVSPPILLSLKPKRKLLIFSGITFSNIRVLSHKIKTKPEILLLANILTQVCKHNVSLDERSTFPPIEPSQTIICINAELSPKKKKIIKISPTVLPL